MSALSTSDPAVLVVGAGPVGLVLACELTRHGVPIRVIDRLAEPTDQSRAIVVHARSLEMLERVGVVEELIASGVRTTGFVMHADGDTIAQVPLDTVDSPFPFSVTTAQTETERVLTERLTALGVGIERGVELVGLEQDGSGVRSTLRRADGGEETVSSAWIAGTDGSHSTVRAQVGARLEGSFQGERFLLGDVDADHELDASSIHTFFSAHDAPLLAFPMRGRRMRLIAQLDGTNGDRAAGAEPTLEQLQAIVDRQAGDIALRSSRWLTIFEIHHAQVPRYRYGRAFLAGDAAHVHSPAGAQGMNTGMQDAFNLGWKLAQVHDGGAGEALLDSYHAERHPIAARVIELTTKATQMGTLKTELARTVRNRALRVATGLTPVQHALADQTEETDVAYRDSPIVAGPRHRLRHAPHPGDAAPDVAGTELRAALVDRGGAAGIGDGGLVSGGRAAGLGSGPLLSGATPVAPRTIAAHTVVSIASDDGRGDVAELAPPAAPAGIGGLRLRHVVVTAHPPADAAPFDGVVLDPDRRVAKRYGFDADGGMVVVRPDGYIGLMAGPADHDALMAYLAKLG